MSAAVCEVVTPGAGEAASDAEREQRYGELLDQDGQYASLYQTQVGR